MTDNNHKQLILVSSNPTPRREPQYPATWLIHTMDGTTLVAVFHDKGGSPHVIWGEAA